MSFGSRSLPPPTADEEARWAAIREFGQCMACGEPGEEIHHLLSGGGLRLGHRLTVMLCAHCHGQVKYRTFATHYPDEFLLTKQDNCIGWPCIELPAARARNPARSKCTASTKTVPRRFA